MVSLWKSILMTKKFTVDWFSGNIPKFSSILSHLENKNNIHFLEIGSFEGRSTCWFYEKYIQESENSTFTAVDTWEGSMEHSQEQKESIWDIFSNNTKSYEKLITLRGKSKHKLQNLNNNYYDFIYVDGSHTTRDVLEDAVLAFDKVKVGGIITFDDYLWRAYEDPLLNPKTGIDAFLICYKHYMEVLELAGQVSIRKIKDD